MDISMRALETELNGVLLIELACFSDERGFFLECFESKRYREAGIRDEFVQDNHSRSAKGVLRGLHFTVNRPQAQIVTVIRGKNLRRCRRFAQILADVWTLGWGRIG
jgi:dTDP-4-dehydrorhamnose 3,5-epimerase